MASTVHRFQGNEKDVILIDITDSLGSKPSKFIRSIQRDEDGARLLNVALSRAKGHIVLTANIDYLSQKLASSTILRRILDIFLEKGTKLGLGEILSFGPDTVMETLSAREQWCGRMDAMEFTLNAQNAEKNLIRGVLEEDAERVVKQGRRARRVPNVDGQ